MAKKVTISFYLNEEVTPVLFAEKVAKAVAKYGTIRVGERVHQAGNVWEHKGFITTSMKELGLGESDEPFEIPNVEKLMYNYDK